MSDQTTTTDDVLDDTTTAPDADAVDQDVEEPDGADQLGDPGKQALDRMKAQLKAERAAKRDLERQLAEATKPAEGDPLDPDKLREEGRRAAIAESNARILKSEVRVAAAGKLNDPDDAVRFLDLSQFEADNDGNFDQEEIADAIADLIGKKPYLAAAQGGRRFQGGADGGTRKETAKSIDDQIAEATAAGNLGLAIALKRQKAYANTP